LVARSQRNRFTERNAVRNRTTRVSRPQSNGIVERLHRTLIDEHFRVEGRCTWFETVEEMRVVLDTCGTVITRVRPDAMLQLRELLKALRLHQWIKNLLVFVPITLGGRLTDFFALGTTAIAFFAIGAIASAGYLINDMWDAADDRAHRSKRHRPLASGRLSFRVATFAALFLIGAGLTIGTMVSINIGAFLFAYLLLSLTYSFGLKRIPLLDGLLLATLFTVRLAIGIVAANVPPSPWLLIFSMFIFASLSFAKRQTEIRLAVEEGEKIINGRGYQTADAPLVLAIGVAAGVGAILVAVLYIVEDAFTQSFYGNKIALWGLPPLLFLLLARFWLKSQRGEMHDDAVDFFLKDRTSLVLIALIVVFFGFAWRSPGWW
jgi:4-hydroxybenzoate polyprenyltransferase